MDDEEVAAEIFQAALNNSNMVSRDIPTLFVIQPQSGFIGDLAKSELNLLINMVYETGYPVADIQFFLKDHIGEDDWQYLEQLCRRSFALPAVQHKENSLVRLKNWLNQNL